MAQCSPTRTASTAGVSRFPNRPRRSSRPIAAVQEEAPATPPRRTAPVGPNPPRSPNTNPGATLSPASRASRRPAGTVAAAARRSAPPWASPTQNSSTTRAISAPARMTGASGRTTWSGPTAEMARPTTSGTGRGSRPMAAARRAPRATATTTTPTPSRVPAARLPLPNTPSVLEQFDQRLHPVGGADDEGRVAGLEAEVGPRRGEGGVVPEHRHDRDAGDRADPGGGDRAPGVGRTGRDRYPVDGEAADRMPPPAGDDAGAAGATVAARATVGRVEEGGQRRGLGGGEGHRLAGGVGVVGVVDEEVPPAPAVGHHAEPDPPPGGQLVADADAGQGRLVDLGHGRSLPGPVSANPPERRAGTPARMAGDGSSTGVVRGGRSGRGPAGARPAGRRGGPRAGGGAGGRGGGGDPAGPVGGPAAGSEAGARPAGE